MGRRSSPFQVPFEKRLRPDTEFTASKQKFRAIKSMHQEYKIAMVWTCKRYYLSDHIFDTNFTKNCVILCKIRSKFYIFLRKILIFLAVSILERLSLLSLEHKIAMLEVIIRFSGHNLFMTYKLKQFPSKIKNNIKSIKRINRILKGGVKEKNLHIIMKQFTCCLQMSTHRGRLYEVRLDLDE
ncbi:hypothetical protein BpHYR1_042157 [Brachionus plicatilis]|uniref:Uncharacterized protein n=1 Tax=Brachionus plicatilis TaxID=10195 RepID=A0A3M7QGL6_BRAPC|nr:hypothetical protein BpHYR1_042157 [Brachionus plicatilis]